METINDATDIRNRTGRIRWACGQVSRHCLCVLREVE